MNDDDDDNKEITYWSDYSIGDDMIHFSLPI